MTSKSLSKLAAAASTLLVLTACNEEVKSDSIDTSGIWAGIQITSNGTKSDINVELNVGGSTGTNVDLASGDKLQVTSGSTTIDLKRDTDILDIDYEGSMNIVASGSEFTVAFIRASKQDAPNSKVTLPATFNPILPLSEQSFRYTDPISMAWTPRVEGTIMDIAVTSVCKDSSDNDVNINSGTAKIADTGTYIFNHTANAFNSIDKSKGCTTTITMKREVSGTLDSNFTGGFIRASQSRTVTNIRLTN